MQKIRYGLVVLGMLLSLATSASAGVSIAIGFPNVSIGINVPFYPELEPVPGYPVYYAPRLQANFFFYDGMYWVYQDDYWYTSDWYDGPWWPVEPEFVPVFILRIPVRYYRQPPPYFYGWPAYAAPPWRQHWGYEWEQRRRGWNRWDPRERYSRPAIAPRPDYQRHYSGKRYPKVEQQQRLHQQHYRYQPRDTTVRERIRPRIEGKAPAPVLRDRGPEPSPRSQREQEDRRVTPRKQIGPDDRRSQQPPLRTPPRKIGPALREIEEQPGSVRQRERGPQKARPQDRELKRQGQGQEQIKRQKKGQEKGQDQDQDQDQDQERYQERGQERYQERGQERYQERGQERYQERGQERYQEGGRH